MTTETATAFHIDERRQIGAGHPSVLIAEIGINHEGSIDLCARMIEAAAQAGADAIKLQTVDAGASYARDTESYRIFSKAALSPEQTDRMFRLSESLGMAAFTTAGDPDTLTWVDRLAPAAHKISSGLLTHHPLIAQAAKSRRPLLMSTGMASMDDVAAAMAVARQSGAREIGLFQCVSLYPTPVELANLRAIATLNREFSVPVGYSDHVMGYGASVLAVAAGACMIEKHFTLDCSRASFDHHISLDPLQFRQMVDEIRKAEQLLGSGEKVPSEAEASQAARIRRTIVAGRPLVAGSVIASGDVCVKRPAAGQRGLDPLHLSGLIGRIILQDVALDQPIRADMIKDWLA